MSWYAEGSPVAGPFREGDELDHLGFAVDDFDGALRRLNEAGYSPSLGPLHEGGWHVAFVPVVEGIWLDVYHVDRKPKRTGRKRPSEGARRSRRRTSK